MSCNNTASIDVKTKYAWSVTHDFLLIHTSAKAAKFSTTLHVHRMVGRVADPNGQTCSDAHAWFVLGGHCNRKSKPVGTNLTNQLITYFNINQ